MANEEQSEYWNGPRGNKWVLLQSAMDALLEAHGTAMLDAARLARGESVLDVGCGCGATSLEAARRVGPEGHVVGLDVSAPMLARAGSRTRAEGLSRLRFERADVQTHPLGVDLYAAAVSRFGVMFFDDPVAAFENVRRALRIGGRLSFACWQAVAENPWVSLPAEAVASVVRVEAPSETAPGPFSFASEARVRSVLNGAGFGEVRITPLHLPMHYPGTADEAAALLVTTGPAGRALIDAPDDVKARALRAVSAAIAPYMTESGLSLASKSWVVLARDACQ